MASRVVISYKCFESRKQNEIAEVYIMKRWKTRCKRCVLYIFSMAVLLSSIGQHSFPLLFYRELFFDEEGNLLDEMPKDPMEVEIRKKISESCNMFEDLIQMAKY